MIEGIFALLYALGVWLIPPDDSVLIVLTPDADGKVGAIEVISSTGETVIVNQAGGAVKVQAEGDVQAQGVLSDQQIATTFAEVEAAAPLAPSSFLFYFEVGQNALSPEDEARISEVLEDVEQRKFPQISVIGHTDTQGSAALNATLALERATSVRDLLIGGGLPAEGIEVRSHGEGDLLVKTADEVDEPRNRRVEVFVR